MLTGCMRMRPRGCILPPVHPSTASALQAELSGKGLQERGRILLEVRASTIAFIKMRRDGMRVFCVVQRCDELRASFVVKRCDEVR